MSWVVIEVIVVDVILSGTLTYFVCVIYSVVAFFTFLSPLCVLLFSCHLDYL